MSTEVIAARPAIEPGTVRRRIFDVAFQGLALVALCLALAALATLIYSVLADGAGRLSWEFLTSSPSRRACQ